MIFGVILMYFLMIGAALMAVGLSVNAVWRAVMPPAGLPRDGAACGSCGYELVTLAEGRCSECGADLLKSGVNTRHTMVRTAGSLPAAIMGWSVIMIIVTSVLFGVGAAFSAMNSFGAAGTSQTVTITQSYRPDRFDRDGSGRRTRSADYQVTFTFDGEYDWSASPQAQTGTVTVEVSGDDVTTPLTLEFDVETEGYTVTAEDGTVIDSGTGYDAEDAESLLGQAGLDVTDAGLAVETVQVGELFEGLLDDPMNSANSFTMNATMAQQTGGAAPVGGLTGSGASTNYGGMGMTPFSSSSAEIVVAGVLFVVCAGLYIGGLVFIVRRRASMIARPRAG